MIIEMEVDKSLGWNGKEETFIHRRRSHATDYTSDIHERINNPGTPFSSAFSE